VRQAERRQSGTAASTASMLPSDMPSPVRSRPRRIFRGILFTAVALLLLPYLVVPFYASVRPVSTAMLWRWLRGARVERVWVALDTVSPSLPLAVIAAEDARFCGHAGVDWGALRAAVREAGELAELRGASTITQQVVKNLFLWQGRSYVRKAIELPLALWTDLVLSKRRIMEIYLNLAEWGPRGEFGAEAGARAAFGKSAGALDRREAALLAAILPNPRQRNPRATGAAVRRLAAIYEARARMAAARADCLYRGFRP
jgi:monofunctional glycosyltransferase